jgi:hypothetical protein
VALLVPALALAEGHRLERVELSGRGDDEQLAFFTDRPANFTSLKLGRPTRVVLDFHETTAAPSRQPAPADSRVAQWSVESLGAPKAPVARVTIELRGEDDYAVTSDGPVVRVRLVRTRSRPLLALTEGHEDASFPGPGRPPADAPIATGQPAPPARLRTLEEARTREERRRVDTSERARRAALGHAGEERTLAAKQARAERLAAQSARRREVALAAATTRAAEHWRRAELLTARQAARAEIGRIERERDVGAAPGAGRDRSSGPAPGDAAAPALLEGAGPALQVPPALLSQLSFRRTLAGARLSLRASREVSFTLRKEDPEQVALEFADSAALLPPDRLPLDTRSFGTAVARVVPEENRAASRVRIRFELLAPVSSAASREGDAIHVDFGPSDATALSSDAAARD